VVTVFWGRPFRLADAHDRSGVPQGIWRLPSQVHQGAAVAAVHRTGTPGTIALVAIFFACFVLYYFANWKILSFLWKVG
jgi:cytochrome c oxidase subunit 1